MNVNLEELAVLTNAQKPMTPNDLAARSATYLQNPRFDRPVALVKVQDMVQRGWLDKNKNGTVELSRQGWAEVVGAIPFLEQLRAHLAMVQYRVVR